MSDDTKVMTPEEFRTRLYALRLLQIVAGDKTDIECDAKEELQPATEELAAEYSRCHAALTAATRRAEEAEKSEAKSVAKTITAMAQVHELQQQLEALSTVHDLYHESEKKYDEIRLRLNDTVQQLEAAERKIDALCQVADNSVAREQAATKRAYEAEEAEAAIRFENDQLTNLRDALKAERDEAREAILSCGNDQDFDWNVLKQLHDLKAEVERLRAALESITEMGFKTNDPAKAANDAMDIAKAALGGE